MPDTCRLEIKTLKGQKIILENMAIDTTIESLYFQVRNIETTPNGKWKLLVIVEGSLKTLKWSENERLLNEFGVVRNKQYRIEVVLDMGACHSTCKR
jgi:hypothetical protein